MLKKIVFYLILCFLIINTSTYAINKPSKKIIFVNMVADLFHAGHVAFLQKAKKHGDFLIVGLHSDEDTVSYKKHPICNIEERRIVVENCKYVDKVICNTPLIITKEFIKKYNINVVIHGDDFDNSRITELYADAIELNKFTTVPYTTGISTTIIINRILKKTKSHQIDKKLESIIEELETF